MSKKMSNLQVLGLYEELDYANTDQDFDEEKDVEIINKKSLLLKDKESGNKYVLEFAKREDDVGYPIEVKMTVKNCRGDEENKLTYLPKGDVYIEGFAIDPKTLDYKYENPKSDKMPGEEFYDALQKEAEREFGAGAHDEINSYVEKRFGNVEDYATGVGVIENNVFSCRAALYEKGFYDINYNLFAPKQNIQSLQRIQANKQKLEGSNNNDPLADKIPGKTEHNKRIIKDNLRGAITRRNNNEKNI